MPFSMAIPALISNPQDEKSHTVRLTPPYLFPPSSVVPPYLNQTVTNMQSILGCGLHHVRAGNRHTHIAPPTIKLNHSVSQTIHH